MPATHGPSGLLLSLGPYTPPLFSVGLSHGVFLALSFLLDSLAHYSSSTHLSICIYHSFHPFNHLSITHSCIHPTIYSSIYAASHLFIVHFPSS